MTVCRFDVSSIMHDSSAIGGKLYGVSRVMIVVTSANYGPMGLQPSVFMLDHYS